MRVLYERCAAVDVGKDVIAVAVRRPGPGPEGGVTVKRVSKTFYGVLAGAARWLVLEGITHVAMEATGVYSMPVYHALIEHGDFDQVLVCNAGHVKNAPGRETAWRTPNGWRSCWSAGSAGSFIAGRGQGGPGRGPDRAKIAQERVSEMARLGNVLQDRASRSNSVASSIATKSGRAMIRLSSTGNAAARYWRTWPRGKMRAKIPDLSMALEGRFGDHADHHPRPGPARVRALLVECAWAAVRHDGYLKALFHRHVMKWGGYRSRIAKAKAIMVVAHALIVIIWHVLATGKPYDDLGADYFTRLTDPEREAQRLIAKLEALGKHVTVQDAA